MLAALGKGDPIAAGDETAPGYSYEICRISFVICGEILQCCAVVMKAFGKKSNLPDLRRVYRILHGLADWFKRASIAYSLRFCGTRILCTPTKISNAAV